MNTQPYKTPEPLEKTLANIKQILTGSKKSDAHTEEQSNANDNRKGSVFVLTDIVKKGKKRLSKSNKNTLSEVQQLVSSIQETGQEIASKELKSGNFDAYIKETLQQCIKEWVERNLPDLMHTALQEKNRRDTKK